MAYPIEEIPTDAVQQPHGLVACNCCGRRFNPDVLERHHRICVKSQDTTKKRKPFNSSQQRAGVDLKVFLTTHGRAPTPQKLKVKKDWRKKHESLVNSFKAARDVTAAIKTGAPLPAHQPSAPDPDYVQCPHCERRFQESAAERHIPFCKEQKSRIGGKNSSKAQDKLNKRLQYKPPSIKRKSSTKDELRLGNPPGASLVARNTNFNGSETFTFEQEEPSPGKPLRRASRPGMSKKPPSGQQSAGDNYKRIPHPPSGLHPKAGSRSQENVINRANPIGTKTRQDTTPKYRHSSNICSSDSDDQENYKTRDSFSNKRGSQLSSLSPPSEEDIRRTKIASLNQKLLQANQKPYRETKSLAYREPEGLFNGERDSSGSSIGSAHHRRTPVNAHGMPMSKFCYECGCKFPVPQAKYCSECGTKRI